MKQLYLYIVFFMIVVTNAHAQYYSVNIDKRTVAAMSAAYGAEAVSESYYNQQVQEILKHYKSAEVAAAGIFASKFLDRKALTDLGLWSSSTENYYYRRIYNMVSARIMPKIWHVAGMMLKSPHNAMYWGSYLVKICEETKALCMQFESVVTNGRLSFRDIVFLQVSDDIAFILKLSELGNVDWDVLLHEFSHISRNFTKDNLKQDIDNLYATGVHLASAGFGSISNAILEGSSFNGSFVQKAGTALTVAENSYNLYKQMEANAGNTILQMIGGPDALDQFFDASNYNLSSWITDYAQEGMGRYYTQRWYIYRRDSGKEDLADYYPPTDDNSIIKGSHWYRINTKDPNFYPNSTQLEQILSNSENHAGWSRAKVNQLNQSNDGSHYGITYQLRSYLITKKGKQTKKAYAYEIHVDKSWDHTEVVYEDYFDSYSMDLNTFRAQLEARRNEFNDNEYGHVYYIGSDSKNYYQTTDANKLKGTESVTISVTCSDGAVLGEGATRYKCRSCGKSLNAHTKECSMRTTITDSELNTDELDKQEQELAQKKKKLEDEIRVLNDMNEALYEMLQTSSPDESAQYRQMINKNLDRIAQLNKEIRECDKQIADIQKAKEEMLEGENEQTDDYYRIPAIMQDCKTAYNLKWENDGSWNGYTFIRKATMPNINGVVTFKATISIVRKPKYFLGIKIHRAIVGIKWELTSEYSDTQVVDIVTLDPSMTDKEKTDLVNKRISEIAREYPDCEISTQYAKSDPAPQDTSQDTYHLLWSSDRLEIAREVDTRLTKIYADLVSLEKMMSYKRSIIDVLKGIGPYIDNTQGQRLTLVEKCRKRWLKHAAQSGHSDGYNGKYEEVE